MIRHCLALDLKDDPALIATYDAHHEAVWPEILSSLSDAGILSMEIYRIYNRLFMIMEVSANFSFEEKDSADVDNPRVVEWEELMWTYQQGIPGAPAGSKWQLMNKIFDFSNPV